jgi:hypothetical protein
MPQQQVGARHSLGHNNKPEEEVNEVCSNNGTDFLRLYSQPAARVGEKDGSDGGKQGD